ncbi:hypothetical protein AOLI_G00140500 [Acnodon oligacanthus]
MNDSDSRLLPLESVESTLQFLNHPKPSGWLAEGGGAESRSERRAGQRRKTNSTTSLFGFPRRTPSVIEVLQVASPTVVLPSPLLLCLILASSI